MYSQEKLRVLSRGSAMVPNYETAKQRRQFHGWKYKPGTGPSVEMQHPVTGESATVVMDGFHKHSDVCEVPCTAEYLRHLRDGDLWAADKETAALAGCAFDPTYGGEHQAD